MKRLLLAAGIVLCASPLVALANRDVTLSTGSSVITLAGQTVTVDSLDNFFDSVAVANSANNVLDFTLSAGSLVKLSAAPTLTLSATTTTGVTIVTSCDSAGTYITLGTSDTLSSTASVGVTLGTSACTPITGSVGGGGGGGSSSSGGSTGGSSSSSSSSSATTVATAQTQQATVAAAVTPPAPPAPPVVPSAPSLPGGVSSVVFVKLLQAGSKSDDVMRLQKILNSDPDTRIAQKGAGSPGNETTLFGAATKTALGKFQLKYGIVKSKKDAGYGNLGPATRAKIKSLFEGSTAPAVSASSDDASKTKSLLDQLSALQAMLAKLKAQ